jgi:hypothetical protein
MQRLKNIIYILGFILLVVIIFFKKDLPLAMANLTWVVSGVLLFLIIVLEIVTKKRKDK